MYTRLLKLDLVKSSLFLLGPRMTGKTTLLQKLKTPHFYNLLDLETELQLNQHPKIFWEEISALPPKSKIIIDEIQKIPSLLNYVQMGIDQLQHCFYLSGSSARKLKKNHANLLGGRAYHFVLHPLSFLEIEKDFSLFLIQI